MGYYTNRTGSAIAVSERWSGTNWSIQTVPRPAGASGSTLTGVSCTSSSTCIAVGRYNCAESCTGTGPSDGSLPLAERWNGNAWTIQTTPTILGTMSSALTSVSCPSDQVCVAVGGLTYRSNPSAEVPLVERYS